MSMPKVSVLMPAYNVEQYIQESIRSILDQTFSDLELIIVDDGSTDRTWELIQKNAAEDKRIRPYRNNVNLRISRTRNRLISLATAKYIAWQDADDISLPQRLRVQYDYMESHPEVGICGGFVEFFGENFVQSIRKYKENDVELRARILQYSPVSQGVAMIRKQELDKIGEFNVNLPQAEDLDLSFRIGVHSKFANVQEVLLRYRQHESSVVARKLKQNILATFSVRINAVTKLGYSLNFRDIFINLLTVFFLLVPSRFTVFVFNLFRNSKV